VAKSPFSSAASIGDLLREGAAALNDSSSSPRLDSEVLLGHVLCRSRSGVLASLRDPCSVEHRDLFAALVARRRAGEPIAYIIGEKEFWGHTFQVTPAVLIPRPETELVVEKALEHLASRDKVQLLDLGTGSGCIAISLVKELLARKVSAVACDAVDKSTEALAVARANAKALGVEGQISFIESDWCSAAERLSSPYDCIVANPPYVDPNEATPVELSFEPASALFSELGGLRDTATIVRQALPLLKPGGVLLCEVGAGKRARLPEIVAEYQDQFAVTYLGDDSMADRFCVVRLIRRD
jgi:release factor glutamine methyltransferase